MTIALLAALLLAFNPVAASTGSLNMTIVQGEGSSHECDLGAFAKAAIEVAKYLNRSDDHMISDAVYRSPAMALREAAAEMEARDAAISAFREQLKKCAWMAEPGAFDRKP